MSLAIVFTRAELGIDAPPVRLEVHVAGGLPGLTIVGLPAAAVREAKDRVRAALQNSGFSMPPRRITVNLAPANLPKEGTRYDLPMALGILLASGQLAGEVQDLEFLGELSLSGELRPVSGIMPAVLAARQAGTTLLIPAGNAAEAALLVGAQLRQANHLLDVCASLQGQQDWQAIATDGSPGYQPPPASDLAEVQGQAHAKRALEIAASGRHNLLLIGPPGSGKSMLAQRLPGICPPLTEAEARQLACIQSISSEGFDPARWRQMPFRAPHHSASPAALSGGGSIPRPGEISLAHTGILFLDELPEFSRSALEMLREPMESGCVRISRVREQLEFPARFQLLAAMNPCPCGFLGDAAAACHCSAAQVARYRQRVSGPLLDRIDMQLWIPRLPASDLLQQRSGAAESSVQVRDRVIQARARQDRRAGKSNAELSAQEVEQHCALQTDDRRLLGQAAEKMQLSGRGIHRVLKLARSIADLDEADSIRTVHLSEALHFRQST